MRVLPALFLLALCLSATQADEFTFEEATPSLPAPAPPAAGDATAAEEAAARDVALAAAEAARCKLETRQRKKYKELYEGGVGETQRKNQSI